MVSRVSTLVLVGFISLTLACGSETPGASPTPTQTTGLEKDDAEPTDSGPTTAPGQGTPEPPPPPQLLTFDFIDSENGWLAFGNSERTLIEATGDGGHTWETMYA